ncbi:MAG: RagB/SusD family nutrient uptake outer membrane protein [Prevotellaceae bacterium]|nr:RagB/SusD family nutrient uptake outer membrane protein [Prevotellaceae bacterium]
MKQKIKFYAICCTLIAVFISCNEFLDINPRTQVSSEEFYKTEDGAMKGLYAVMKEAQNRLMEVHSYSTLLSDEAETGGGIGEGSYKFKWDNFTYTPTTCFSNEWYTGTGWWNEWDMGLYVGIVAANILIDELERSGLDESFVRAIDAETRFYRALYYTYLFMGWKEIPLLTGQITSSDDLYSFGNASRTEVYEFLLGDLSDEVIQYLPDRAITQKGRICKDAAKVLRAKIILFHRDESKYQQAYEDIRGIANDSYYQLTPDYLQIWHKAGEWGRESIFEIGMAGNNSGMNNKVATVGGRDIVDPRSAEQGGLMSGYGQLTMTWKIYDMFSTGDTRREGTVIVYADEAADALSKTGTNTFYVSDNQEGIDLGRGLLGNYKYHPRKESYTSGDDPVSSQNMSYRFYRFADVLLLGAELKVRISGDADAEAQGWFDKVRDRAFQDQAHRISLNQGKDANLNIIFQERYYEFAFEMQRWFDILRFDKGAETLGSKGWTEKHRYFPIDQNEIDQSKGALTQDPAWL